jgi:CBS domain-containing protein
MTTDLFTVRPEDLVDLAASVMDWEHIRHVPVEDDHGRLVGLVSHRALLRLVARGRSGDDSDSVPVSAIMKTEPVTIPPSTPTLEAMRLMREGKLGCLPVVKDGRLVGLVTEHDLIEVSAILLEKFLQGD